MRSECIRASRGCVQVFSANKTARIPMPEPEHPDATPEHGDTLTAISDGIVGLLREHYGRGPTRTKSYYHDDLVVCVLRGGSSRAERTLIAAGRGHAVLRQRIEFQDVMRERFEQVVSAATGRTVIGCMSGTPHDPDLMCEIFMLAPSAAEEPEQS